MRPESQRRLIGGRNGHDGEGVLLEESLARGPIEPAAIFGNRRPVEMEIGCGKGTFLLARAAERPEVNFLGVEWARSYCLYAADRVRRAGLANVRMLCADAAEVVRRLPEKSLWRVHVYFPDPWPKTRHRRRRLIQPLFVRRVRHILRIGGQLLVVTDHLDYFRQILRVLSAVEGLTEVPLPPAGDRELVGSNFERKYLAQGRPFYKAARMRYA